MNIESGRSGRDPGAEVADDSERVDSKRYEPHAWEEQSGWSARDPSGRREKMTSE